MKKEDKNIKNIIAGISESTDESTDESAIIDIISKEGETDLADFARSLIQVKNSIEPDKDVLLKILDKIPEKNLSGDYSGVASLAVSSGMSRLKLQLFMPKIIKFAVPSALIVLLAVAILSNPFEKETKQVAELRDIGKDEQSIESAVLGVDSYLKTEKSVSSVDATLNEVGMLGVSSMALPEDDFFGINAITPEEQNIDISSNLSNYLAQEQAVSDVDIILASF